MSDKLSIQQKQLIDNYRQTHSECSKLSDAEILTIMNEQLDSVSISEDEKVSAFWNERDDSFNQNGIKNNQKRTIKLKSGRKIVVENDTIKYYAADGTQLNQKYFEKQEGTINIKPSGRYSITKNGKTKYYDDKGKEIQESYFKSVESADVVVQTQDGKSFNINQTLEKRINNITQSLQKAEKNNGLIGKAWGGFKNLTGIGDSSDKVREQQKRELKLLNQFNSNTQRRAEVFKELTGQDYNQENLTKFIKGEIQLKSEVALKGYTEGQDMATDVGGDLISGIAAVGIYSLAVAAAPVTGGASIAIGVGAAALSGAAIKTGVKALDSTAGDKKYTLSDAKHDSITGAFSGLLAPITGGLGGAVGKTVATKMGLQAVKAGAGSIVEQTLKTSVGSTLKTALVNPAGYEYIGGNLAKRGVAMAAEMATDGALGGAIDGGFRAGYDNDWDTDAMLSGTIEGGIGGALMAPIIGGGFKAAGKGGHKLGEKIELPDLSWSSIKAKLDYQNFKKRNSISQNDKHWKISKELDKPLKAKLDDYKNAEFQAFKREGSYLEDEINKEFSYKSFYQCKDIASRANEFLRNWNEGHIIQQAYLENLSSEQAGYVEAILRAARGQDDYNVIQALERTKGISSPANAYMKKQYFLNESRFKELGWDLYELQNVNEVDQAVFIMNCLKSSKKYNYSSGFKNLKTPEQVYLYSKVYDHESPHFYEDMIKEIKTEDDFNFAAMMLADKKAADECAYYFSNILYKMSKDSDLKPYIIKFFKNPKLVKDKDSVHTFCHALEESQKQPELKKILKIILSNEKLQEPEFLKENGWKLFRVDNPKEYEQRIAALNYIIAHKEICDNPQILASCAKGLFLPDNKQALESKMYVLDYILSHKNLTRNEKIMTRLDDLFYWVTDKQSANAKIKAISILSHNKKLSKIKDYVPEFIINFAELGGKEERKALNCIYEIIVDLLHDKNFQKYKALDNGTDVSIITFVGELLKQPTTDKATIKKYTEVAKVAMTNSDLVKNLKVLKNINMANKKQIFDIILNSYKYQIPENRVKDIISMLDRVDLNDYKNVVRRYGYGKICSFNDEEFKIAVLFENACHKSNLNEIPMYEKKKLLQNIVFMNADLFNVSSGMIKEYPLLPKTADEYCDLLPTLVRSLGIETKYVQREQVKKFNHSLSSLSKTLSDVSDKEFANLTVTQSYPKDSFIKDVLRVVKDMPRSERQKVYDYFGFELHHNSNNETGFSITGYPVNLNNGKKLAHISDPRTKAIVEELRPYVVKFSEHNKIKCNNLQVEQLLNDIVDVLPELRTAIGKKQHKTQKFDIMQHSLKVLKKVSEDSGFKKLNDSDKKIMILSAILHDITKGEGFTDNTHAYTGSFDAYYICKKLRLTEDESIKLYTLIKHHEWLEYVNTARRRDGKIDMPMLTTRLQSVAYDLQQDNLFEMALMFTHADLRSVKVDDSFHDVKVGANGRTDAAGSPRSYGDLADDYAKIIRTYINDLKATQPLLPHTTTPKATRVRQAITRVNYDGSTNLKGVYVDKKDGLVIIKFNEATDKTWEAIGMPKGSSSKTAKVELKAKKHKSKETVDVGNINFIVHGLGFENQMVNFDAFALKDSEALLSVSYTERPRDKYRFFRAQGLTLKVKNKYIHGGGETDAGSGCKKSIEDFKQNYVFGGYRESDRVFFSKLVKEATGMSDSEYIKFVQDNADKPMSQITPAKYRDKIIAIYAEINSRVRKNGERSYNECYASNVEAAAPFAYPMEGSVGNPVEFMQREDVAERTDFLRKYAHKNDEVFIVFGD